MTSHKLMFDRSEIIMSPMVTTFGYLIALLPFLTVFYGAYLTLSKTKADNFTQVSYVYQWLTKICQKNNEFHFLKETAPRNLPDKRSQRNSGNWKGRAIEFFPLSLLICHIAK